MPPPSEAWQRYEIIDSCLINAYKTYPTMQDFINKIKAELKTIVSKETIQKDIAKMKMSRDKGGFDAPIKFKKAANGYFYDFENYPDYTIRKFGLNKQSIQQIELAAGVLQRFKGVMSSDSFNQTLNHLYASLNIERNSQEKSIAGAILPEDTTYLRGMENFELFVDAIKRKLPVSFIHYSYQSQTFKANIIHPYLLKESNDRWYLVGYSEEHGEIRYFGLDRIYDPYLIALNFKKNKETDLTNLFANKIGLRTLDGRDEYEIVAIKIWISKVYSNYFKSMPLHKSQSIVESEEDGNIIISLELVPTYELISVILSFGKHVELMEPKWLRRELKKELNSMLSSYSN